LSIGHIGNEAEKACKLLREQGLEPALYDMRFVKPLDEALLHDVFKAYPSVITVEDASIVGGFGSAIAEFMVDHQYANQLIRLGIPDTLIEHGEQAELYRLCGIDSSGIAQKIAELFQVKPAQKAIKSVTH
jgi:1-deoxy-D-xylulose-5-phosphate synthase